MKQAIATDSTSLIKITQISPETVQASIQGIVLCQPITATLTASPLSLTASPSSLAGPHKGDLAELVVSEFVVGDETGVVILQVAGPANTNELMFRVGDSVLIQNVVAQMTLFPGRTAFLTITSQPLKISTIKPSLLFNAASVGKVNVSHVEYEL